MEETKETKEQQKPKPKTASTTKQNIQNIYEKLNVARNRFAEKGVKKSGYNKYSNYYYFDLEDVLPIINQLAEELKFTVIVYFTTEEGILEVINTEKPEEKIIFKTPMSTAKLTACHEVQNLGAVETYLKRYLYQNAFEIAETDSLDKGKKTDAAKWTPEQQSALAAIMNSKKSDGSDIFTEDEKKGFRQLVTLNADFKDTLKAAIVQTQKILEEFLKNQK